MKIKALLAKNKIEKFSEKNKLQHSNNNYIKSRRKRGKE